MVQQRTDNGSWEPATPLGFIPGYDAEIAAGEWTLYRNTRTKSVEVARGRTILGLRWACWWRRILRPVRR